MLGQPRPITNTASPNLVEGRELYLPNGVALDTSVSPPVLYVADAINNRVLAWKNATSAQNGVKADLVIGQRDFFSTGALGSGTSSGLASPTGLLVDSAGNLWVADSGSNRILRYPKPFQQTDEIVIPNLVLGQSNFTSRTANRGEPTPIANGLNLVLTGRALRSNMAFDPAGNLWVTDAGNHRVLRYPAASVASGATTNGPSADIVFGQTDFTSRVALGVSAVNRTRKDAINTPAGVVVDSASRVYVTDGLGRIVVWAPPYGVGSQAARIVGVVVNAQGQPPPPTTPVNAISVGITATSNLGTAEGVFLIGGTLAVVDTAAHRITRYAAYDQWPAEGSQFSPSATAVTGQPDLVSGRANSGGVDTTGGGFNAPVSAVSGVADDIYVVDAGNNRVLRLGGQPSFRTPLQVFGQIAFNFSSPNLVEGKEFFFLDGFQSIQGVTASFAPGTGIATDGNILYVADTINHRVLGFRDVRTVKNADRADLVIGQTDLFRTVINSPSNDSSVLNDSGLFAPAGLAVDSAGNLWVTDSGNGRVLRYPRPFDQPQGSVIRANLVLGQSSFTSKFTDPTSRNMSRPFGIGFMVDGSAVVSDAVHNRVLLFRKPAGGDFANGQSAEKAIGQPDFVSTTVTNEIQRMLSPRGLTLDASDRLFVCDTGRARVAIFDNIGIAGTDPTPSFNINLVTNTSSLNSPHGVYVSPKTGEIWVADTIGARAARFPRYELLVTNPLADQTIAMRNPLAIALDQFGNLIVADASNRVAFYYPALLVRNAANFLATTQRPLAPNTYGSVGTFGPAFADQTVGFSTLPMPTMLADTQVLLNDQPIPLHFVSPSQINFLTPNSAPTSGTHDLLVVRASTGQVLSAGSLQMSNVSPGMFTTAASGTGQLAASNQDGTVNGPDNAAPRGSIIALYGTGTGVLAGAPPDGMPPTSATPVSFPTTVFMGTALVPQENIQYSGLSGCCVGLWQVNVKIPESILPGNGVVVQVTLAGSPSYVLPQRTTISVKQQ